MTKTSFRSNHAAVRHPQSAQGGFAMIEVLISMLIISIWLLASAGMQVGMFKLQKSAESRLQALSLATELGERMEANAQQAQLGSYTLADLSAASASTDCAAATCSPAELAKYDLKQWADRVSASLIVEKVSITRDVTAAQTTYNISISWKEPRGRQTYTTTGTTETASFVTIKVIG